jgi:PKHD-type hydroxylase
MIITIPNVLSSTQIAECRTHLNAAEWIDGKVTAGSQSGAVKHNQQLAENSPTAIAIGDAILDALARHPLFISAALPLKIFPPLFNKYEDGGAFGLHVDNAIRHVPGTITRLRTDLSATLFFSEPDEYEGGELIIEDNFGAQTVKLAAGDMILYPSTSLHQVTPVTRGARVCSFFWMQSMIRDNHQREMLFDMDQTIQSLTALHGSNDPHVVRLSGIYHNLVRQWAEV